MTWISTQGSLKLQKQLLPLTYLEVKILFWLLQNVNQLIRWSWRASDRRSSCNRGSEHQQLAWRHIWDGRQRSSWICSRKAGSFYPFHYLEHYLKLTFVFLKVWLTPQKGKGLEISGTWSLRNNVITMEMTFSNKAMQAMQGFGIQLNKNSFGMTSSQPLNIPLLNAGQTLDVALPMTCTGPVQKMDPLTNIQVLFYMEGVVYSNNGSQNLYTLCF